ncbi:MAG: hypothetical protein JWQ09_1813 [Segetibacter sp.]|nr:hypothetical protein [Segetibacter sp.]
MRIFFIPGLGEETFIFDKIQPFIPGEKIFIDNWRLLADIPEKDLTALVYAAYLIEHFKICKEDVVIGHSLGGWVAVYIKQLVNCPIIQIASWTDMKKVMKPFPNRHILYWFTKQGWGLNPLVCNIIVTLKYKHEASKEIFKTIFEKLRTGNKEIVAKQLMIVYNPVEQAVTAIPELRIHAKTDKIVRPPDQPYSEVPGDHFTLYTYPETVYKPITAFLKSFK